MAAKSNSLANEAQTDDIPLPSLEESLLSLEKLDRASPELWPELKNSNNLPNDDCSRSSNDSLVPGVSEFVPLHDPEQSPPSWNKGLTKEDYTYMRQLGTMSTSNLIMEVKRLHDCAYQLGLEEAKEMTRGKYLNIFSSKRHSLKVAFN